MAEIDVVEIEGEDVLLGVFGVKVQGPADLPELALDRDLRIPGHVPHQLLGDGGAALGIAPGGAGEHGPGGAVPVHALVLPEAVVLNGHHGLDEAVGQVAVLDELPVALAGVERPQDLLLSIGVLVVDGGGQGHGHLLNGDLAQGGDEVGVDVGHEELCEHAEGEHTDDAQSEEHQKNFPDEAQNRKFLLFLAGRGPGGAARTAGDGLIHRWRYLLTDKNCSQGRREDGRTGSFERGNAPSGTPVWSAKI